MYFLKAYFWKRVQVRRESGEGSKVAQTCQRSQIDRVIPQGWCHSLRRLHSINYQTLLGRTLEAVEMMPKGRFWIGKCESAGYSTKDAIILDKKKRIKTIKKLVWIVLDWCWNNVLQKLYLYSTKVCILSLVPCNTANYPTKRRKP